MTDDTAPDDLAAWSLHCFCITARRTPHGVVRLDRNGRLLHAARHGISRGALREQGLLVAEVAWLLWVGVIIAVVGVVLLLVGSSSRR